MESISLLSAVRPSNFRQLADQNLTPLVLRFQSGDSQRLLFVGDAEGEVALKGLQLAFVLDIETSQVRQQPLQRRLGSRVRFGGVHHVPPLTSRDAAGPPCRAA